MDISGFVGLAVTGPIDVPVRLESVDEFENVFGPMAGDSHLEPGPQLGATVAAFFANGGRRCWVTRVDHFRSFRTFHVPSLLVGDPRLDDVRMAWMRSRAAGPWADGHRLGARFTSIDIGPFARRQNDLVTIEGDVDVEPGDLVQLTGLDEPAIHTMALVVELDDEGPDRVMRLDGPTLSYRHAPLTRELLDSARATELIDSRGTHAVTIRSDRDPRFGTVDGMRSITPGQVVRLIGDEANNTRPVRLVLAEETYRLDTTSFGVRLGPVAIELLEPSGLAGAGSLRRVDGLIGQHGGPTSLVSLGPPQDPRLLVEANRRRPSWSAIPTDDTWYRRLLIQALEQLEPPPGPGLRIPFAGPSTDPEGAWPLLWPLEQPPIATPPIDWDDQPAHDVSSLGVEPHTDASTLFVDRRVAGEPVYRLAPLLADYDRLAADAYDGLQDSDPDPGWLRGVHGFAPIDEIGIISCPDATHSYARVPSPERCLPPTVHIADGGRIEITGTGGLLEVQVGSQPNLADAGSLFQPDPEPLVVSDIAGPPDPCAPVQYLRARELCASGWSPWSETLVQRRPFDTCDRVEAPTLQVTAERAVLTVALVGLELSVGTTVEVEVGNDPALSDHQSFSTTLDEPAAGAPGELTLGPDQIGHWYLGDPARLVLVIDRATFDGGAVYVRGRVISASGVISPWSVTSLIEPLGGGGAPAPTTPPGREDLVRVHLAMVRLCAAQRNAVALLSFPPDWDTARLAEHVAQVRPARRDDGPVAHGLSTLR